MVWIRLKTVCPEGSPVSKDRTLARLWGDAVREGDSGPTWTCRVRSGLEHSVCFLELTRIRPQGELPQAETSAFLLAAGLVETTPLMLVLPRWTYSDSELLTLYIL